MKVSPLKVELLVGGMIIRPWIGLALLGGKGCQQAQQYNQNHNDGATPFEDLPEHALPR
ncbi:MAG: hypothetical protein FWH56_02535 [Betaproteobacteria bacterium]|nr:hypothetical protein [Betaproteobacteria bacterium]